MPSVGLPVNRTALKVVAFMWMNFCESSDKKPRIRSAITMHYGPPYLPFVSAMLVQYWVMLTYSSSTLISTGINMFSDVIGFCNVKTHKLCIVDVFLWNQIYFDDRIFSAGFSLSRCFFDNSGERVVLF